MSGQGPIGKSPPLRFVDDTHHPGGSSQCQPWRPKGHHDGGTRFDHGSVGKYIDAWTTVRFPRLEADCGSLKDLWTRFEGGLIEAVVVPIGALAAQSCSDLGVSGLSVCQ